MCNANTGLIPQIVKYFENEGLKWWWMFAIDLKGGKSGFASAWAAKATVALETIIVVC